MSLANRFQKMTPNALVPIAGVGYQAGGLARDSDDGWPMGVVRSLFDLLQGDLIVVDYHAHRLWRIDRAGILHALAGDGIPGNSGDGGPALAARFYWPHDLTQDKQGNLYLSDLGNQVDPTHRRQDGHCHACSRFGQSGTGR